MQKVAATPQRAQAHTAMGLVAQGPVADMSPHGPKLELEVESGGQSEPKSIP